MGELPLRPDIEDGRRGASLDLGKQGCPRDMRQAFETQRRDVTQRSGDRGRFDFDHHVRVKKTCDREQCR